MPPYQTIDEAAVDDVAVAVAPAEPLRPWYTPRGLAARCVLHRNLIAFFVAGLLNNLVYVVMLSAAEHVLEGWAGAILLADILPTLIVKLSAPFFMHRVPYTYRVVFCTVLAAFAFFSVALFDSVFLKILGVCAGSLSSGAGEITFLAMSSRYSKNTVSTWSSGTGGAGLAGAGSYLVMTKWFDLSPSITLIALGWTPLVYIFAYLVILDRNPAPVVETALPADTDKLIDGDGSEAIGSGSDAQGKSVAPAASIDGPSPTSTLTLRQRVRLVRPLLVYMVPLFLVYLAEYTINQGVVAVYAGDDYATFQMMYQTGVFFSRSSVNVFRIEKLWILPVLQIANVVILLFHAAYDIFPVFLSIYLFALYEGFLGGLVYVNGFYLISTNVARQHREFSMGVASVADTFGISFAALCAMAIERNMRGASSFR